MSLTKATYSMIDGAPVNVLDYGADPTGATDSRAAIQAAMTYAWLNGRACYVPGGTYLIDSVGPTFGGKVYGLWLINALAGPGFYDPFRMYGDGYWVTKFNVTNDVGIDRVLGLQFNGESCSISDIGISAASGTNVEACLYIAGAGPNVVERIWCSGADNNFYFNGGEPSATDIFGEFANTDGIFINEVYAGSFDKISILSSGTNGIRIIGTTSGSGNIEYQSLPEINISNFKVNALNSFGGGAAAVVDIERYAYMAVNFVNGQLGNNGFQVGSGSPASNVTAYSHIISECSSVSFTNVHFIMPQYGGIVQNANSVKYTGCTFSKTGFTLDVTTGDPGTTWACRDISISNSSSVSVVNCLFDTSAGNAIWANGAKNLTVIGNKFIDVSNGGLDTDGDRNNAANATVGDANIFVKPTSANDLTQIIGNYFESDAALSTGRFGIVFDGTTAVPTAGNVMLTNNTNFGGVSFGAAFSLTNVTVAQKNAWYIINDGMATATPQGIPTYADADAPNSTLYFSSTASKLVWKNSAGVVNDLY